MIVKYTCDTCGLVTRIEEGQEFRACACNNDTIGMVDGYTVELEEPK